MYVELDLTSTIIKGLYQDNIELKTKHETLLSRLPTSPADTAPTSPIAPSPNRILSPAYPDAALSRSPDYADAAPRRPLRHTRRISVTPSDLTHLADQNAELLDKLERLEAESARADQAGKQRLRKLEREILLLQEELEETQAKEAELEQAQAHAAVSGSGEEARRRKEEREERVRVYREKAGSSVESTDTVVDLQAIKDFAPPSGSRWPTKARISSASTVTQFSASSQTAVEKPVFPQLDLLQPDAASTTRIRPRFLSTRAPSGAESAIVSQLLHKIRELEETNAQISKEQQLTEDQLRSAQWDAESIRRVYDCLDGVDGVELEVVAEDSPEEESPTKLRRVASGGTIKFSSLRRSIHQDLTKLNESPDLEAFASGISGDMRSTVRSALTQQHAPAHRSRRSVVGLFEHGQPAPDSFTAPFFSPAVARIPRSPALGSELGDLSTWSIAATYGQDPPSPALDSGLQTPLPVVRTLGSELGSECGDDWGTGTLNYHLRTTSLYGMVASDSREPSMSFAFATPDDSGEAPEREDWGSEAGPSTPQRISGLQLMIEPPTPTPPGNTSTPKKPASVRQKRLSQTVRSRTHRWLEGRFSPQPSSSPPPRSAESIRRRPQSRTKARSGLESELTIDDMFDEAAWDVSHMQITARGVVDAAGADDGEDIRGRRTGSRDADRSAMQVRPDTRGAVAEPHGRVTRIMLELRLWLQFGIVILVFLYAMARRGPKSVLEEADRRRAGSASV